MLKVTVQQFGFFLQAGNVLCHTKWESTVEGVCIHFLLKCARRETATVNLNTSRLSGSSLHSRTFYQELGAHHSSGKSWLVSQGYPKLKLCQFSFYPSWSGHLWAVPKHPLNIYLYHYSFPNSQRRTRAGFKQSLNLCNFLHNIVAAYTFSVLPGILQILNKVLLSPVTVAYPRGASTADGMCHYPALFSPVLAFSGLLCRILWLKSKAI